MGPWMAIVGHVDGVQQECVPTDIVDSTLRQWYYASHIVFTLYECNSDGTYTQDNTPWTPCRPKPKDVLNVTWPGDLRI